MREAGPEVGRPVRHPVEELVDAEQDRRHGEADPQKQEGLEGGTADVTAKRAQAAREDRTLRFGTGNGLLHGWYLLRRGAGRPVTGRRRCPGTWAVKDTIVSDRS